jgi:hypothetical protein
VKRRQKKATTIAYYGEILIEEWDLDVITNNGWMEGDCLNFAFSEFFLDQRLPSVSASVYLLQSGGNIELQVSIISCYMYVLMLSYLHPSLYLEQIV